jgi:hypothetical protein
MDTPEVHLLQRCSSRWHLSALAAVCLDPPATRPRCPINAQTVPVKLKLPIRTSGVD